MTTMTKICALCGESCAGRPRIKDDHGHYYCRPCYDDALARKRAREAAAATPSPAGLASPGGSSILEDAIVDEAQVAGTPDEFFCPSCHDKIEAGAVLCVHCGYNLVAHTQVGTETIPANVAAANEPIAERGGFGALIMSPLGIGVGFTAVFAVLMGLGMSDPELVPVHLWALWIYGLAVGITSIVVAFREGILHGIATLLVPFYMLIFVFLIQDDGRLKAAMLAYIAGAIFFGVLVASVGMEGLSLTPSF